MQPHSRSTSSNNSAIAGNSSNEIKRFAVKALAKFIGTPSTSYGAGIGTRLRITEVNIWDRGGATKEAQTVCEIQVDRDMCNIFGTMHGGCAAFLIDPCSVSALICLGLVKGIDGSGVSQAMNLIWHKPAYQGAYLQIISTTVSIDGHIRTAECQIRDKNTGQLYVSAVHSTAKLRMKL
ncbi:hypothetical protein C8J56DRAFT_1048736 [Mycena floridula]|nr:hypothetical protein C8J56DRAFT_1048736 [Mycena floridula]